VREKISKRYMQKEGLREYNRSYLTKKLVKIKRGEKKMQITHNHKSKHHSTGSRHQTNKVCFTLGHNHYSHNQKSPCMLFAGTRNRKQKQKYGNNNNEQQEDLN